MHFDSQIACTQPDRDLTCSVPAEEVNASCAKPFSVCAASGKEAATRPGDFNHDVPLVKWISSSLTSVRVNMRISYECRLLPPGGYGSKICCRARTRCNHNPNEGCRDQLAGRLRATTAVRYADCS